ncbi:MAG TPA: hypothetical protein VM935_19250 [Chitinophagaceae bacterium]|jgi:hypothetical protein|nr:hypothetical protein [Chitinophagaceae bacterium]
MRTSVPRVRTLVLICTIVASSISSFSQSITLGNGKLEAGLAVGPLFFLGDLGGNQGVGKNNLKDVNMPLTKISKGLFVNIYPTEWLGFRLAANHGTLEGYDHIIKDKGGDEFFRKKRNLQFQSSLLEAYAAFELYPTVFFERYDGLQGKLRPYGVVGVGMFKFNPKGQYFDPNGTSRWVELAPLHTEGQGFAEYPDREPYKLSSIEMPLGVGFKYYFKENKYIGFEVMHRKSFTDYVDDVSTNYIDANLFDKYLSPNEAAMARQLYNRENFVPGGTQTRPALDEQRGDPKDNDSYFSSVIRFGWRLTDKNSPDGRAARQMRCPSFY